MRMRFDYDDGMYLVLTDEDEKKCLEQAEKYTSEHGPISAYIDEEEGRLPKNAGVFPDKDGWYIRDYCF